MCCAIYLLAENLLEMTEQTSGRKRAYHSDTMLECEMERIPQFITREANLEKAKLNTKQSNALFDHQSVTTNNNN